MTADLFCVLYYRLNPYAFPPLVTALAVFGSVVHLLRARLRGPLVMPTMLLLVPVAVWLLSFAVMYCATEASVALVWAKFAYVVIPLIPAAAYDLSMRLLNQYVVQQRVVRVAWVISGTFTLLSFHRQFVAGVHPYWWGFYPEYGALGRLFLFYAACLLGMSAWKLWQAYHLDLPWVSKWRLRWFALALVLGFIASVDILPKLGLVIYPFGYVGVLLSTVLLQRVVTSHNAKAVVNFEMLGEVTDEPLLLLNRKGEVQAATRAAASLLGVGVSEIVGRPLRGLLDRPHGALELVSVPGKKTTREAVATLFRLRPLQKPIPKTSGTQEQDRPRRDQVILLRAWEATTRPHVDLRREVAAITEITAKALAVLRVSVWRADLNEHALHCVDLYNDAFQFHTQTLSRSIPPGSTYRQVLEQEQRLVIDDVGRDHRLEAFLSGYFEPLGIVAVLEFPIRHGPELVGVLSFEQIGRPRAWSQDEQLFGRLLANILGLLLRAPANDPERTANA